MLNEIAFWLFFLPVGALDAINGIIETMYTQGAEEAVIPDAVLAVQVVVGIPLIVAIVYFMIWGQACTLMVAKRLVASPAGRTRTSFSAVRSQARKYIGALFITEVLRSIITLLFALLLIVPGVIYSVRTVFYDIMMIERGKIAYGRDALSPSIDFVKGKTWDVFWRVLVIGACVFLPVGVIDSIIIETLTLVDIRLETLAIVLTDIVDAFGTMFFIVCAVALYADLKKSPTP